MSFSFNVVGTTKDEVRAKAAAEMATVAERDKVHARDQEAILQTLDVYLGLLPELPEGKRYSAGLAGAFSWNTNPGEPYTNEPSDEQICCATGSVNVAIIS